MEVAISAVVLTAIVVLWLVGSRRLRRTDDEQRVVLEELEGQRVTAEVVVGTVPGTKGAQLVATTTLRVGRMQRTGMRFEVSDVEVSETAGVDARMVAEALDRDGIDARDVLSVTTSDGQRHDFGNVRHPRRAPRPPRQP